MERPRLTVGAIILNQKGEILIMKSPKWFGKYVFPGGHVEFGETLEQAVKREVKEEVGLDVESIEFITLLEFINSKEFYKDNLHFVGMQFACKTLKDNVSLSEEATEYKWIKPNLAIEEDLTSLTLIALKQYLNKKQQSLNNK